MSLITGLTSFVQAVGTDVKSILSSIGSLSTLKTTSKTNLVSAINEIQPHVSNRVFLVDSYGAVGDGTTDDYVAIQAACTALQTAGGGRLVFTSGKTYFINQHRITGGSSQNTISNFLFSELNGLKIEGNGAKIVLQGGWERTADTQSGSYWYSYENSVEFEFDSCVDLLIENLEIDGGAATITKATGVVEGDCYGIVLGGCVRVSIQNVNLHHFCTDGLYVVNGGPTSNFTVTRNLNVKNSVFANNARQGCSIIQCRWAVFDNCMFTETGNSGDYGSHAPSGGVDIEPNYNANDPTNNIFGDDFTGDITFINCGFVNNEGPEFVSSSTETTTHPVTFLNCNFESKQTAGGVIYTESAYTLMTGCTFTNESLIHAYTLAEPAKLILLKCNFSTDIEGLNMLRCNQTVASLEVDGCTFDCTTTNTDASDGSAERPIWITIADAVFKNNTVTMAATSYYTPDSLNVPVLLQDIKESSGNRFVTDLTTSGKVFVVSYNNTLFVDDLYPNGTYFSPDTSPYANGPRYQMGSGIVHELPSGGTAGQVLAKNSAVDYDVTWSTASGGSGSSTKYVGVNSTVTGTGSNSDGTGASGTDALSIGGNSTATSDKDMSIGYGASASGGYSTAMGSTANASGIQSFALGYQATAIATYALAIGKGANAENVGAIGIGNGANGAGNYSVAIGNGASATQSNSGAIGNGATGDRANAISFGSSDDTSDLQLIHVAAATEANDVVIKSQLDAILSGATSIQVVSALPATPDANTVYIVTS